MQRNENNGVVISCDFCGTDWDEVIPMIEGHHGSVLCLGCLKKALDHAEVKDAAFSCTMCLREGLSSEVARWSAATVSPTANPSAVVCIDCINQAAGTFSKDSGVDWQRPRSSRP